MNAENQLYKKAKLLLLPTIILATMLFLPTTTYATDVWDKANELLKDVYTRLVGISSLVAVVTGSIALIIMNFSKSGRAVDESRSWLKRIAITWMILNGLGFIMAYVTPYFQNGIYTP